MAALKKIRDGGYANLVLREVLPTSGLTGVDARFVTDLVYGVCRSMGTLDLIIEQASGRRLSTLQPAVVDILRLGSEQLLRMRVPTHAAVSTSVDLAHYVVGRRATGVVNAILRKISVLTWEQWIEDISGELGVNDALAVRTCHPRWIVEAYSDVLPGEELLPGLEANNTVPIPTLAIRPTLMTREELLGFGGEPTQYSPWGVVRPGDPSELLAVRTGRAGVQDEGSQLVAGLLAQVDAPSGPWLDMCAGPGGKTALLAGLAREPGETVVGVEVHEHRAVLVRENLRGFLPSGPENPPVHVLVADGRKPSWGQSFSRVLVDAPCTGLGALRRRPEARWRKRREDLAGLRVLQQELLMSACRSTLPGGVVAYVTCSPHVEETAEVVDTVAGAMDIIDAPGFIPDVPHARASTDSRFLQLWPHRHGTDAMFCALLRKP